MFEFVSSCNTFGVFKQGMGEDPYTGEPLFSFRVGQMIDGEGKPCTWSTCEDVQMCSTYIEDRKQAGRMASILQNWEDRKAINSGWFPRTLMRGQHNESS